MTDQYKPRKRMISELKKDVAVGLVVPAVLFLITSLLYWVTP
jgi:hypothetical protein